MGYGRALLMRDVKKEEEELQKKAKKKSLWGSIGRTIGGLGAMALTGGAVNPLTVGLISGGASFLGGAVGASTLGGGKLTGGRFFQSSREEAQKELGAFGTQNLTSALTSGLTAGIGQATKLYVAGSKAAEAGKSAEEVSKIRKGVGFKEGYKDSFFGKIGEKRELARQAKVVEGYEKAGYFDEVENISALDVEKKKADALKQFLSSDENRKKYGDSLYREGAGFGFDDVETTRDVMALDVTPVNIDNIYPKKVSAWDKFKDFVDVSDVKKERDIESKLSQYREQMIADIPTESVEHKLGIGTGYDPKWGYRPSTWKPEEGTWLRRFYDEKY